MYNTKKNENGKGWRSRARDLSSSLRTQVIVKMVKKGHPLRYARDFVSIMNTEEVHRLNQIYE